MHTMWKGSISFGLVNIPIKLYSATENKDIKMRYLHEKCHTPIKYEKTCPNCEKALESDEIVRGYEYEDGKFVIIERDEIEALAQEKSKSVEIVDFVELDDIDPVFFNRSYFIGPNDNGSKPYMLLKKAMETSGRIGIAKITIRSKEHLAAVRVYKNGLMMETMYFPDEVRELDHVPDLPEEMDLSDKELKMAQQLIEQLTTEFDPSQYQDERREAIMALIQSKISGDDIKVVKEKPKKNVVDLMDALQASLEPTGTTEPSKPKKQEQKKKKVSVKKKKEKEAN
ncbi:Ku protein [Guptibacillus algicola]|uniref:non-homologous end joining protein Ku n=1 Tax=Guptibacillus algicola TaxID=225844 RepID=UPI001CD5D8BE|nr:Ku protein [Alkalihalobacillus algicola]MCA0987767.1 Ku protein [Alkalihalobacillus algicola]